MERFNLREYIKKGFLDAIGKMSDYQIILNSAGYLEKGVLTENDLAEINEAIEKSKVKNVEDPADDFLEEFIDDEDFTEDEEITDKENFVL